MAYITYRLTPEGWQEFATQLQALGDQGQKALDAIKAKVPEFANAWDTASKKMAETKAALEQQSAALAGVGTATNVAGDAIKLTNLQVQELTYSARHLWEEISAGVSPTQILATQVGHLSAAFTDLNQVSALFARALPYVGMAAGVLALGGAIGVLADKVITFQSATDDLNKSLQLHGNILGITSDQYAALASEIAKSADVSDASARRMVASAVDAGVRSSAELEKIADAVQGYAYATGENVDDAWKDLLAALADHDKYQKIADQFGIVQHAGESAADAIDKKFSHIAPPSWLLRLVQGGLLSLAQTADSNIEVSPPPSITVPADNGLTASERKIQDQIVADYQKVWDKIFDDRYQKSIKEAEKEAADQKKITDGIIIDYGKVSEQIFDARYAAAQKEAEAEKKITDDIIIYYGKVATYWADQDYKAHTDEQKRVAEAEKRMIEESQRYWDEYFRDIHDGFNSTLTDFFETGKFSTQNLLDSLKHMWAQFFADLVEMAALRPIELQIVGSMQGVAGALFGGSGGIAGDSRNPLSLMSAGLSGSGGLGFGGSLGGAGGLASLIPGLGSGIGGAVDVGGQMLAPIQVTPQILGSGVGGIGSLLGAAGTGLGIGALGGMLGGLVGLSGNGQTGASLGGTIGGAIGSIIPGVGTIIGSIAGTLLGGAAGSLFGGKPSNYTGFVDLSPDALAATIGGDKPNANTTGLATQIGTAITQFTQTLAAAGVQIDNDIQRVRIGQRDQSQLELTNGQFITAGPVGDANAATNAAIAHLLGELTSTDSNIEAVIRHYMASGGVTTANESAFLSDVQFAKSIEGSIAPLSNTIQLTAQGMKDLTASFQAAEQRAQSLGLDVTQLTQAYGKSFQDAVQSANDAVAEALKSPFQQAFDSWKDNTQAMIATANALGVSTQGVLQLSQALKQQLVTQYYGSGISSLQGALNNLTYGDASNASPSAKYFGALSAYNSAKSAALATPTPDAIAAYSGALNAFLPVEQSFLGVGPASAKVNAGLRTDISTILGAIQSPSFDPTQSIAMPISNAVIGGANATVAAIDSLAARLDRMDARAAQRDAQIQAILNRLAA